MKTTRVTIEAKAVRRRDGMTLGELRAFVRQCDEADLGNAFIPTIQSNLRAKLATISITTKEERA